MTKLLVVALFLSLLASCDSEEMAKNCPGNSNSHPPTECDWSEYSD